MLFMAQLLLLAIILVQLAKFLTSLCPSHTKENTEAPLSQRLLEPVLLLWLTLQTVFMELEVSLVIQLLMALDMELAIVWDTLLLMDLDMELPMLWPTLSVMDLDMVLLTQLLLPILLLSTMRQSLPTMPLVDMPSLTLLSPPPTLTPMLLLMTTLVLLSARLSPTMVPEL